MSETNGMGPKHPRWQEFLQRLSGPEGCNFHYPAAGEKKGQLVWNCLGDDDYRFVWRVLGLMNLGELGEQEFFKESIKNFQAYGGYCDCEVITNAPLINGKRNEISQQVLDALLRKNKNASLS